VPRACLGVPVFAGEGRPIRPSAGRILRVFHFGRRPRIRRAHNAKAMPTAESRSDRCIASSDVRAVPKVAVIKIPREPPDSAKALIARRESICARCEHFNGVCTLVFPQVKGCRSLQRYRPSWLAWLAEQENACPLDRRFPDGRQEEDAANSNRSGARRLPGGPSPTSWASSPARPSGRP
jgi:hypothetical protein